MKKFMIRKIPIVIGLAVIGVLLFSGVVMLLWNSILPAVLHVSAITLWQAAGILLLSKILFGGFRRRHGMWHGPRKRMFWHCMTQQDKEQMHQYACYSKSGHGVSPETDQPVA